MEREDSSTVLRRKTRNLAVTERQCEKYIRMEDKELNLNMVF